MVYQAIFFDYGGLLANCVCNNETNLRAHNLAKDFLTGRGIDLEVERISQEFSRVVQDYIRMRKAGDAEWSMHEIISRTFRNLAREVPLEALVDIYRRTDHNNIFYPDTLDVIPRLSELTKLAIVSDCPHDSSRIHLEEAGLLQYFATTTFSHEVGYRKPNPLIYQVALERTGVSASDSLFVSHEQKDLDGAKNVGMQVLLVDRENNEDLSKILEVKQ